MPPAVNGDRPAPSAGVADSGPGGEDSAPGPPASRPAGDPARVGGDDTVGTGSALAIGCSVVSVLLILFGCLLLWWL